MVGERTRCRQKVYFRVRGEGSSILFEPWIQSRSSDIQAVSAEASKPLRAHVPLNSSGMCIHSICRTWSRECILSLDQPMLASLKLNAMGASVDIDRIGAAHSRLDSSMKRFKVADLRGAFCYS